MLVRGIVPVVCHGDAFYVCVNSHSQIYSFYEIRFFLSFVSAFFFFLKQRELRKRVIGYFSAVSCTIID